MPDSLFAGLSAPTRRKVAILARCSLAIVGGYLCAALATASLALALPLPRPQAVLAATQLSFALYCVLIIWCFVAATPLRAALGIFILAAAPALHLVLSGVLLS